MDGIEKQPLDALAFEPQVAHGFEIQVLSEPVSGLVRHFEQRIVGIVEQRLQTLTQLQGGLIAHLQQRNGQTRRGRAPSMFSRRQGHYLALFVHPVLLAGCRAQTRPISPIA